MSRQLIEIRQQHQQDRFVRTAIGLAICRIIAGRNRGGNSVESAQGLRSTFHFTLAGAERKS
jgi:light-regulated signal transduction histidine kinase (bacteriophytochrome)